MILKNIMKKHHVLLINITNFTWKTKVDIILMELILLVKISISF